jgi:hypothetical protein
MGSPYCFWAAWLFCRFTTGRKVGTVDARPVIHDGWRPPRKALAVALEEAICCGSTADGRGLLALVFDGGMVLRFYFPLGLLVAKGLVAM